MQEVKIVYQIKILQGELKGETIKHITTLDELEERELSSQLMDNDYLDSYCNSEQYYKVLERTIIDESFGTFSSEMVMRIFPKIAGNVITPDEEYELLSAIDGTMIVENKRTKKSFTISWKDIFEMAQTRGV